jgi:hypothetical protein
MGDAAHWLYRGGPSGQPSQLDATQPPDTTPTPCPFGQGYAEMAGVPKRILVPQPAAGAEWVYKHSGPSWLLLRSVVWQLQTAVAAATRASRLQVKFGGDLVAQFPPGATQAASLTVVYQATDCGLTSGDPATAAVALSNSFILGDNMSLGSNTANIQAADQYSAIAIYGEEFTDFEWD